MAKKKAPTQKNWRPKIEDVRLLAEIKSRTGIQSETDIIRLALRVLAANKGLSAEQSN